MSHPEETAIDRTRGGWADAYRDKWKWDRVTWGTHCADCYPANCPYRVYVRDGRIVREEPAGTFETVEAGVPDMNPAGCQKGAAWSQMLHEKERVLHPLRRVGERGEGRWKRVSWDEALTEIADAMLDAMQESGPRSIVRFGTTEGGIQTLALANSLFLRLGATVTDVNAEINDLAPGLYITFGRFASTPSVDDWFHSELLLIWATNPVYSAIPWFHYITEARYHGSEVVTITPKRWKTSFGSALADIALTEEAAVVRADQKTEVGLLAHERLVDQALVDEDPAHREGERGVGTDADGHELL